GRILSYFYLAIPVGSALGYLLGGLIGHSLGWHTAFLLVGLPGLLLTLPLLLLKEPLRENTSVAAQTDTPRSDTLKRYIPLLKNRSFVINTLSMAAMTFALGGLAQWMPTFLYRMHSLDVARGNTVFGVVTVVAGITGTLTGGLLGDRFQKKSGKGYLTVSGWGFLIGAPVTAFALITPSLPSCIAAMFLAEYFLFLSTGPLNTVVANVSAPSVRAMAFAVNIFFIHALGDAVSPAILGRLSDQWGLRNALMITPFAILLAAFFSFLCTRSIERDGIA
ncbi:MAG TPA: MFS transporter, partial [Dissulfurispiraceae bacterium]